MADYSPPVIEVQTSNGKRLARGWRKAGLMKNVPSTAAVMQAGDVLTIGGGPINFAQITANQLCALVASVAGDEGKTGVLYGIDTSGNQYSEEIVVTQAGSPTSVQLSLIEDGYMQTAPVGTIIGAGNVDGVRFIPAESAIPTFDYQVAHHFSGEYTTYVTKAAVGHVISSFSVTDTCPVELRWYPTATDSRTVASGYVVLDTMNLYLNHLTGFVSENVRLNYESPLVIPPGGCVGLYASTGSGTGFDVAFTLEGYDLRY